MRWFAVAVVASVGPALGCAGGVTLTLDSDRVVPAELDAVCLGVADRELGGGSFGRTYRLVDRLATLPQTLAVEPGAAEAASALAIGYRAGTAVSRASARLDFSDDVALRLDRCPAARAGALVVGAPAPAPAAIAVASQGHGGTVVVALDGGGGAILDVVGGQLVTEALPGGGGDAIIAADLDGDCADDLAIARGGQVEVWWRRARTFTAGPVVATAATALAAADVDGDGDLDLIAGAGAAVTLWRNDGAGGFALDAAAVDGRGAITAIRALAAADLDGDGHADVIVGQAGAPLVALVGDASGTGTLTAAPGVFAATARTATAIAVGDLDGDLDLDLVVAIAGAGPRVFINRGGLLEDQTFVRVPQPAPVGAAAAVGDWDGDCRPDAVLAGAPSLALIGTADGALAHEADLADATAVAATDLDDDGAPDAVLIGADGARWVHR
ncbi:MAG: VCBS repeat-containing protein [Myxococcales bacterium]|nr:VCBS repeat-containing protein [Myxococcales bacterium]